MWNKKLVSVSLAAVLGLGAQLVQLDDSMDGVALDIGMPKAEAGVLDKIGGTFNDMKGRVVNSTKKKAEERMNKALAINLEDMNLHNANMTRNMSIAAGLFMGSEYQICQAIGKNDATTQQYGIAYQGLIHGNGSMPQIRNMTTIPRVSDEEMKKALYNQSKDKNSQAEMEKHMRWSKSYETQALYVCGLVTRDALFMTKESLKGLKNAKNPEALQKQLTNFKNSADDVVTIVKFIKRNVSDRHAVRKEYDKLHNISAPSQKEIKDYAASLGAK